MVREGLFAPEPSVPMMVLVGIAALLTVFSATVVTRHDNCTATGDAIAGAADSL